ncbi:hypothetical protein AB0368_02260 [Actinoplanes sp. NPDC051475]|uniref:hypothetical protein n=1 Tax=Actinoplanes sp. NPDC051475 TaxID=3157225 RepID=UPI00344F3A54
MTEENERTGADVVREVIVALSPRELPFLESVLDSYRLDPWTLEDDARSPVDQRVPWAPFAMGFVAQDVVGLLRAAGWSPGGAAEPPGSPWWGWLPSRAGRRLRWGDLALVPDLVLPALEEPHLHRIWTDAVRAAAAKGLSPADREAFAAAVIAGLTVGRLPLSRRCMQGYA